MRTMRKMIFRGLVNGLRTTWDLAIIIVPVYLLVFLLQQTAILSRIGTACRPLMAMMGLPGEAAMGVVLGNLLNLYAAIGAVSPLALETSQITVFALLLLISHSLVVETAVSRKVGIVAWPYVVLRLGVGFIVAVILHRCWLAG